MNPKITTILVIIIIAIVAAVLVFGFKPEQTPPVVLNFADCARHYEVMESYPRQCKTPDGRTFIEDIGNALEKEDLIRASSPTPNSIVTSPLTISGEARGNWYFEASFPVKILDANGNVLLSSYMEANGEWMTTDFVPFSKTFTFPVSATTSDTGTILLEKDNPSGLPEHDDQLRIPVRFR